MTVKSIQSGDCRLKPTVVIALDLELSWGSFDHSYGPALLASSRWTYEEGAERVLDHLVRNDLPATWAFVGAMMRPFLPDVSRLPEVHYRTFRKSWFHYVPAGEESQHPEWFATKLVKLVREAPKQEVAFHSFSHVLFGEPGTPAERARKEMQMCVELAKELGVPATSFVFPRNSIGYLDELREAGFTCFRDRDKLRIETQSRLLRSLQLVLADFFGTRPKLVEPTMKSGLVALPGSLMIRHAAGWRSLIPDAFRRARLHKGLESVQKRGGMFLVWLHPENLYVRRPRLENVFAEFTAELGALVKDGAVRCMTMGDVAREYLSRTSTTP